MSQIVDNLIAFRILHLLVTPFNETQAFKKNLIDEKGVALKKVSEMTNAEKDAYTYLHRLVFNVKRGLNKLPGGENKFKSLAAAMYLIKEAYENNDEVIDEGVLNELVNSDVVLVEETLLVEEFSGAIANVTGGAVSTDIPVIRLNNGRHMGAFAVGDHVYKRFDPNKKKYTRWSNYLNMDNVYEKSIYDYVKNNPKGILILRNGKDMKVIKP